LPVSVVGENVDRDAGGRSALVEVPPAFYLETGAFGRFRRWAADGRGLIGLPPARPNVGPGTCPGCIAGSCHRGYPPVPRQLSDAVLRWLNKSPFEPITAKPSMFQRIVMSTTAQAVGFGFVEQLAKDLRDERLELPAFPEAVLRIQRALQSPDTSTDDIVKILSSEPTLAARLLRIANSAEFRRMDQDVTDLRKAVSRMGFNMVRSVSVAFAMRQLRKKDTYTPVVQKELEHAWHDSVEIAAACFVIAKRFTKLNPDQALLTGLLHVLGRLYIIMRSKDAAELSEADFRQVVDSWHASIGKAIIESWGLPEEMQHAIEHQDELELKVDGQVSLTDVLIGAKLLTAKKTELEKYPALRRIGVAAGDRAMGGMEEYAEELKGVKSSLSE